MEHNVASQVQVAVHCEWHRVFSKEGRLQLDNILKSENGVYVITVPPYTFVLGNILNKWLIIDSHVISEDLGGNGNGIRKVFDDVQTARCWIWKRLFQSKVISSMLEISEVTVMERKDVTSQNLADTVHQDDQDFDLIMTPTVTIESGQIFPKTGIADNDSMQDSIDLNGLANEEDSHLTMLDDSIAGEESIVKERMDVECESRLHNQSVETLKWEAMQSEKWGPYQIPLILSWKKKLTNKEALQLVYFIQIA